MFGVADKMPPLEARVRLSVPGFLPQEAAGGDIVAEFLSCRHLWSEPADVCSLPGLPLSTLKKFSLVQKKKINKAGGVA